jgi:hypothetical protein
LEDSSHSIRDVDRDLMGEPYVHVNYDFGAADHLAWALWMTMTKVHALIELRKSSRSSFLGSAPGNNWEGKRRDDFDKEFVKQQQALMALEAELESAWKAVNRITEQAHMANAHPR